MPQFNILYNEEKTPEYDKNFTRSCVGFRTKNTLKFKAIINFIANIVSDGNFSFTEDGITFTSMDNSQISLIDMLIPKQFFSAFNPQTEDGTFITLGINIKLLVKVLNRANKNDEIILKLGKRDSIDLSFVTSKYNKCYCLKLMDITDAGITPFDADSPVEITIESKYFSELVNDFNDIGEDITFKVSKEPIDDENQNISLTSTGDMSGLEMVLCNEDLEIENIKDVKLDFAIKNLLNFTRGSSINKNMTIQLDNDFPMKLTYPIFEDGYIEYYIAPRVEEDDDF